MTNCRTGAAVAALTALTIGGPDALAQVVPPPDLPHVEPVRRADATAADGTAAPPASGRAVAAPGPTAAGYSLATFIALAVASHGASFFDAAVTRAQVRDGGYEENPLVRPFVRSYALFAVTQIGPFIFDGLGWLMARSSHHWIRRLWWVPQTFNALTNVATGIYDLR